MALQKLIALRQVQENQKGAAAILAIQSKVSRLDRRACQIASHTHVRNTRLPGRVHSFTLLRELPASLPHPGRRG